MNWSRAKIILIAVFLITDIFLGVRTYTALRGTRVSVDIINNTKKILTNNNIAVSCEIPRKANKLSWMIFQYEDIDKKAIAKRFFDTDSVEWTASNGEEKAQTGTATLVIQDDTVIFSEINPQIIDKGANMTNAEKKLRTYLKKYFPKIPRYSVDKSATDGAGNYSFTFVEMYNNSNVLFDNYITVNVGENGLVRVESLYIKPLGTTHEAKDILSVNEILLAGFMNDVKGENQAVTISDIKLGYLAITGGRNLLHGDILSGNIQSAPSWRIRTTDGKEYFYNAYNGRRHIRNLE